VTAAVPPTRDELWAAVEDAVRTVLDLPADEEVPADVAPADLGLGSLGWYEVGRGIETRFGIPVSTTRLMTAPTLIGLVDALLDAEPAARSGPTPATEEGAAADALLDRVLSNRGAK
jgi:hypothetical protein